MRKAKKREKTRAELRRSNKTLRIVIIVLIITCVIVTLKYASVRTSTISKVLLDNSTNASSGPDFSDQVRDNVVGFIEGVLLLKYPFMLKFLIFLGGIYLIQVALSITGDIFHLILLIGVATIRIVKFIYHKIKGVPDDGS